MNILYISYDGLLDPLGSSQITPYLAALSEKGARITLLTYEKKKKLNDANRLLHLKEILKKTNIKWKILRYHKSPKILATPFDILAGTVIGLNIISEDKICLVHARSFIGAIPALILTRLFSLRFIFDMRGFWPEERVDGSSLKMGSLLYKIARFFEKKLILNSDQIVVLTKKAKERIEKIYFPSIAKPIEVIPTCVDLNLFSIKKINNLATSKLSKNNRFIFSYLGSLGSWYMLAEMVDFFIESRRFFNNPLFLMINNNEHAMIKRTMHEKKISSSDYLIKSLDYWHVSDCLAQVDVSMFFIKPVLSKIASCPTKLGESLACGIPVIINYGIGDTEEIIKKENVGVVLYEFSDMAYRKAIVELSKLLQETDSLRERCRDAAKKYLSLDDGVAKYATIYQRLLGS